jgi:hypothetical protein
MTLCILNLTPTGNPMPLSEADTRAKLIDPTLPTRADSDRSWTVSREEIEARGYDLKAVNPNAKADEDLRKPEELLDLIEAKGKEVTEALARLRDSN